MYSEMIGFEGSLEITVGDRRYHFKNLVVNGGLAYFMAKAIGLPIGQISHMAVGFSSVPAVRTQTALLSEQARSSVTSLSIYTMYSTSDSIEMSANFAAGAGTGDIYEAGLFTPNGVMISRAVFPKVIKAPQEGMAVVWRITGGATP